MITTVTLNPTIDGVYRIHGMNLDEKYRTEDVGMSTGGKGIYVAKTASVLGGKVNATGFLEKVSGRFIQEKLEQLGIYTSFIWIGESPRTDIAIVDPFDDMKIVASEKSPMISKEELNAFVKEFIKTLKHSEIIIASGSVPEGLPKTIYRDMVKIARNNNVKMIIDTCGKCLEEAIRAKPFMIKPNIQELEGLVGYPLNNEYEIIFESKHICRQGIDIVAISLGAEGAIFTTKESGVYRIDAPKVSSNHTIGCGDAFLAGFVVSLYRNNDLEEAFKAAVATGTANALEREVGQLNPKVVKDLYAQVKLKRLVE